MMDLNANISIILVNINDLKKTNKSLFDTYHKFDTD